MKSYQRAWRTRKGEERGLGGVGTGEGSIFIQRVVVDGTPNRVQERFISYIFINVILLF